MTWKKGKSGLCMAMAIAMILTMTGCSSNDTVSESKQSASTAVATVSPTIEATIMPVATADTEADEKDEVVPTQAPSVADTLTTEQLILLLI